jgi:tetratricopeptide (TPR) repeat protein
MKRKRILLISFMLVAGMIAFPVAKGGYYFIKGLMAFRQGLEGESVRYLERSVKTNPNFLEAYMSLALAYAEWGSSSLHYIEHDEEGLAKLKSETLGRAENILKAALARFPYHHFRDDIQYMLGRIYDEDSKNSGYVWDKNKAIQGYIQLVSEYPHSRYAQKAKKRIEALACAKQ